MAVQNVYNETVRRFEDIQSLNALPITFLIINPIKVINYCDASKKLWLKLWKN